MYTAIHNFILGFTYNIINIYKQIHTKTKDIILRKFISLYRFNIINKALPYSWFYFVATVSIISRIKFPKEAERGLQSFCKGCFLKLRAIAMGLKNGQSDQDIRDLSWIKYDTLVHVYIRNTSLCHLVMLLAQVKN